MVRWLKRAAFLVLTMLAAIAAQAQTPGSVTVLAAASLTNVLQEIGRNYQTATGRKVAFSFAASMTLAKQIEASAGSDVFISADEESMDYLAQKNLMASGTRTNLLANSLVLIAPADSKIALTIAPDFKLGEALHGGRLALANPDSVPAGRYGRMALMALGVWDGVKDHLAQGEDVRATLAYVARGEVPLGIVYGTDARIEPKVRIVGVFPETSHEPILYPAALTKDAKPDAAAFLAYLKTPAAGAVLRRAGFSILEK